MDAKNETYLTPAEVSKRLGRKITVKTLSNWRSEKGKEKGPPYVKLGGKILYPLSMVEEWEGRRTFLSTSTRHPAE